MCVYIYICLCVFFVVCACARLLLSVSRAVSAVVFGAVCALPRPCKALIIEIGFLGILL